MNEEIFVAAPTDLTRVNVALRADIRYWTRALGVSEHVLRSAVKNVGEHAWDVRAELRRRRRR